MAQPSTKPDTRPTVLHPIELATFIQHTLFRMKGTFHLVVCSSQEVFLRELLASIQHEKQLALDEAEASGLPTEKLAQLAKRKHDLLVPTLMLLANAQNIQITFCESIPQLHTYLSVYTFPPQPITSEAGTTRQTIALINPIALHRTISSFSAQGLSRTFAAAVEASSQSQARLLVVECPSRHSAPEGDVEMGSDDAVCEVGGPGADPCEEEISILNVTTKSFGAGERGWVGRTVRVRAVAERWCVFKSPA